jgi:antitoxin PrlF
MKLVSTLTSKGQITVPKPVRQTLGLAKGDGVEFTVQGGQVSLRAIKAVRSSSGVLRRFLPANWTAPTIEEMDAGIARQIAERQGSR